MIVAYAILAALFGGAIGSFAGVASSRGWRGSLKGRSYCDNCARSLSWFDLIPLVSYPVLRGRCRTCHTPISLSVFAWEAGGALLALAVALPIAVALGTR